MNNSIPKLLGHKEVTQQLGWSKQLLNDYIRRGKFPIPIQVLASSPIWTEEQILAFKESRNNTLKVDEN